MNGGHESMLDPPVVTESLKNTSEYKHGFPENGGESAMIFLFKRGGFSGELC